LEAAKVAAQRGHHVNLFPMGPIGGLSYYRGLVPGMKEFHKPIDYYQNQLQKLGVVLNDGNFDENLYDVILDGTWGKSSQDCAITILQGEEAAHSIGILDDGLLSCEVALYLLNQGKKVDILSRESKKIRDAHPTIAFYLLERLHRAGISFVDSMNPHAYDRIISPTVFNQKSEIKTSLLIYEIGDAYEASELAERVFNAGTIARMI
jgi:hypothetical protein